MQSNEAESAAGSSGKGAKDCSSQKRGAQFFELDDGEIQEEPEPKYARAQGEHAVQWKGAGFGRYFPVEVPPFDERPAAAGFYAGAPPEDTPLMTAFNMRDVAAI